MYYILKELILCKKTTVSDALFAIIIVNSIFRNIKNIAIV